MDTSKKVLGFLQLILLFLHLNSFSTKTQSSSALATIMKPQQVIQKLWQQPLHTFDQTFAATVERYTAYCATLNNPVAYTTFVEHCRIVNTFLKQLLINEKEQCLVYGDSTTLDVSLTKLFTHWQSRSQQAYYQFYMLYFDCVAYLFIHAINQAYMHRNDAQFGTCTTQAEQYHNEMMSINKTFVNTPYEEHYAYQLSRYYDLLQFGQAI